MPERKVVMGCLLPRERGSAREAFFSRLLGNRWRLGVWWLMGCRGGRVCLMGRGLSFSPFEGGSEERGREGSAIMVMVVMGLAR